MVWLARIFLLVDLQTLLLKFSGKKKKNSFLKLFFYFFPPTLNIIYFDKKEINIFLRFCLCIFENATVKGDCPMQENYEIFKDLIQTVGLLY